MFGKGKGARKYSDKVTLTLSVATVDDYGNQSIAAASNVAEVWASVDRMSATRSMQTFQQADIIGLDIEFRAPIGITYNGVTWQGHDIHFAAPEDVDGRCRIVRIAGYYQQDNP